MTKENIHNYYFDLSEPIILKDIKSILSLNTQKEFYRLGSTEPPNHTDYFGNYSLNLSQPLVGHSTSGIFRGQIKDWALLPKAFREIKIDKTISNQAEITQTFKFSILLRNFSDFCDREEIQNPNFPKNVSDRLSIAQHFGMKTNLLDWSLNIFTAIFFALREVYSNEDFTNNFTVYIYHIEDERFLDSGIPDKEYEKFPKSSLIKPYAIDRRIERQKGVFTFHPYPGLEENKIPVKRYMINDWNLIRDLINLMKGFGYTEDYFFPDYAGIANAVISDGPLR